MAGLDIISPGISFGAAPLLPRIESPLYKS